MKRILIYLVTTFGLTWTFWSIGISGPVVMGMPVAELAAAVCVLAACWIYFYKGYYRLHPISVVVTLGLLVLYAAILWKLERRLKNEAKRQLQEQGSDAG